MQAALNESKRRISAKSKENMLLEHNVRYLDGRIGLLIANRMGAQEQGAMASACEGPALQPRAAPHDRQMLLYSHLFTFLQTEPQAIVALCACVASDDLAMLLSTILFTLYGNQYTEREEHLLLTLLRSALELEFDAAHGSQTLLRANSVETQMITMYTRRLRGQVYVQQVLSEPVQAILAQPDRSLELEPSKVYAELVQAKQAPPHVPYDQMSELAVVQECIRERSASLSHIAADVLGRVIQSLPHVPYGIRWICKQIWVLAQRNDAALSDAALCALVGAFFFLRFINPAILAPQEYLQLSAPEGASRRTLILLVKLLQNLVNNPSAIKDPMMHCLQPFMDAHGGAMRSFLYELGHVDDFATPPTTQATSLTITLNEVYHMHTSLQKHAATVAPGPDHPLGTLLEKLGPAPPLASCTEDYAMELPLFHQQEHVLNEAPALGTMDEYVRELAHLDTVLDSIDSQTTYLRSQLDTYKSYLQNARIRSGARNESFSFTRSGLVSVNGKEVRKPAESGRAHRFPYHQLEREGLFAQSSIPHERRPLVFFHFTSPSPGTFLIAIHYQGRPDPVLEMDVKVDDLLETQRRSRVLDLDYVQLDLARLRTLLHRLFGKPRRW